MRRFGIIGFPLSHSFSQKYFTQKFINDNISDAVFINYPIEKINELPHIVTSTPDLQGLAVTIPYKKQILPYLASVSDTVAAMGACNCVRVKDGNLYGYNTDVIGFEKSFITHLQSSHTKALLLGSGGASAAVEFILKKLSVDYKIVTRSIASDNMTSENMIGYEAINEKLMEEYTVIINSTPLGTYPDIDEAPPIPYQYLTSKHYLFDLVYNPPLTKFLRLGQERGATVRNGYDMLTVQAEENWKIWNE